MTVRTASSTAAPAMTAAQYPARYQAVLRGMAAATLTAACPREGVLVRAWPHGSRVPRSWPPGVTR